MAPNHICIVANRMAVAIHFIKEFIFPDFLLT